MTARLPRTRLRMKASDLQVGESSWVRMYNLHVQGDGRVYLQKRADMVPWAGKGDWPNHNTYGDYLVERTEEGFVLHVFKDDLFGTDHDLGGEEAQDYFAFVRIELHVVGDKPCATCGGRGWHQAPDGRDLKRARTAAGLTQAQMAERLQCEQPRVSKLENGQLRVTTEIADEWFAACRRR